MAKALLWANEQCAHECSEAGVDFTLCKSAAEVDAAGDAAILLIEGTKLSEAASVIAGGKIPIAALSEDLEGTYIAAAEGHIKFLLRRPLLGRIWENTIATITNDKLVPSQLPDFDEASASEIIVNASRQIDEAAITASTELGLWPGAPKERMGLQLVWQEMLTNAVYHSGGHTKEKVAAAPVELPADKPVTMRYQGGNDRFTMVVTDLNGTLTAKRVLEALSKTSEEKAMLIDALRSGADIADMVANTGRGFDLLRYAPGETDIIIRPNESTSICMAFDKTLYEQDPNYFAVRIHELA